MVSVGEVARVLGRGCFPLKRESDCQLAIDGHLRAAFPGVAISREHRLSGRDRPDWLIDGRFVVEAKVHGAVRAKIERQLQRYAEHDAVEGIVLATGRSIILPATIGGKPVAVVNLGEAWL
ncbi:hypothetical protein [Caulobacter vibrioides]|uniref:hypothetical protein n=1 Tax=Caulobacter vibrioides TaxID=155892 RepID=UPI0015E6B40C|nr:hypothetical protein [Caulobacter vibrioides]